MAYYNFIEVSGWLPAAANTRFENSRAFYHDFAMQNDTMAEYTAIVPHAPYSVSAELWHYIQPYFSGKTISIHNQETAFEDELFLSNAGDFVRMYDMMKINHAHFKPTGLSSLQSYFPKMQTARNAILVHNTFTKQADVQYAMNNAAAIDLQLFFCLCINANLYIENAVPPVQLLLDNNSTIVLGTDSLASNHSLSLLDEIKTLHQHFPAIELATMLRWATINGAHALQMQDTLGSFEKGKKPGIIQIDHLENLQLINDTSVTRLL